MTIVFTGLTFTGNPDADDIRAAKQTIAVENIRLAALPTPGTPWPMGTLLETKASYMAILIARITVDHVNNITLSKSAAAFGLRFSPADQDTVRANMIDQLNAGASVASIIAKTV
jgi:hypothetical protein